MDNIHSATPADIAGVGVGLRTPHIAELIAAAPTKRVPWLEVLTDNFLGSGGLDRQLLLKIRETYSLALHGVGLSLGSTEPLDWHYLKQLKQLARDIDSSWVSDHLAFVSHKGRHFHDLLPLPYTEEALKHLIDRVLQVQDYLGERILIENVSSYIACGDSELNEGDFLAALAEGSDCHLLLDINNAFVNQQNHGWDARELFRALPLGRVKEIHLAGFQRIALPNAPKGEIENLPEPSTLCIDTHSRPVDPAVWQLYKDFMESHQQPIPTLIEWDKDIPSLSVLLAEARKASKILEPETCQ